MATRKTQLEKISITWSGFVFVFLIAMSGGLLSAPVKTPPAWSANDIAVIINDNDALSRRIGEYYQSKRQVPPSQIIHVRFKKGVRSLTESEFKTIKQSVDNQTQSHIQGYVLTWLLPFRVDCMSITTAFAAGFDKAFCAEGCQRTRRNPYFDSISVRPYDDFGWRPAIVVAGDGFTAAKALIDRGFIADYSKPKGAAYLLKTSDLVRSSRAIFFPEAVKQFKGIYPVNYLQQDDIEDRRDIMFYFTGLARVNKISANKFLPGAIADHLTSAGGVLADSYQMSIMEWIKAGASGSYGAVVEPCNFPEKFSKPGVLMKNYLNGSSLIEAYWKSVEEPGQGIFVGDPLAKPFARLAARKP